MGVFTKTIVCGVLLGILATRYAWCDTLVDCTFEKDTCGMTVKDHPTTPVSWARKTRDTITRGAKPRGDHTSGARNGHFMFFDGSISQHNHKSLLYLPPLNITSTNGSCIELSHIMIGQTGTLRIFLDICGNTMSLWSYNEENIHSWTTSQVVVPPWSRHFGVIFEATRHGSGDVGISIDDVIVRDSPCTGLPTTTTPLPTTKPILPASPTLPPVTCPTLTTTQDSGSFAGFHGDLPKCPLDFCEKDHVTCTNSIPGDGFFCECPGSDANTTCYREFVAKPLLPYAWSIPLSLLLLLLILLVVFLICCCRHKDDMKFLRAMLRENGRLSSYYAEGNKMESPKISMQNGEFDIQMDTNVDVTTNAQFNDIRLHIDDVTMNFNLDPKNPIGGKQIDNTATTNEIRYTPPLKPARKSEVPNMANQNGRQDGRQNGDTNGLGHDNSALQVE